MDCIHCTENLSLLCLHVFFFSWCVAHVRNTVQVLLSFCVTWFPLWKFKTSRSRCVFMTSAPAVLCLNVRLWNWGQLPGSALADAGWDSSPSEAPVTPIRSALCTLVTTFTVEMWFYFLSYEPVFLYWMQRPCLCWAERNWVPILYKLVISSSRTYTYSLNCLAFGYLCPKYSCRQIKVGMLLIMIIIMIILNFC